MSILSPDPSLEPSLEPPLEPSPGAPSGEPSPAPLSATPRTALGRSKDRARTDRAELYAVLDAGLVCHLGVVAGGVPMVVPTGYGRIGDTLYLHGSTGATSLRADGEVCVTVTHVDGVVLARSAFHHSVNYRSAMIYGRPRLVTDPEERLAGLRALTEQLAPGQWDAVRPPTRKELAATAVLALSLAEASVKVRQGPPVDDEEDYALPVWAGVLPLRVAWGEPEPDPAMTADLPVPAHIATRNLASR
ncbi:pyridoxamine 5'-phosphate oxidase family protein [Planomonospora corallina]|uniref:Pyridoxamine 5'-phosphate oxidase family protein n=1 Tax=Planomonospora corallina TaxID=1806052 RepID=A0ABV8IFC4_9ACTN